MPYEEDKLQGLDEDAAAAGGGGGAAGGKRGRAEAAPRGEPAGRRRLAPGR